MEKNVLRNEEIMNNSPFIIRSLVDMERAKEVSDNDGMLDTPIRKQAFSDITIEFDKHNINTFRIIKSIYCNNGVYINQTEYSKIIGDYKVNEDALKEENKQLKLTIKTLEKNIEELKNKSGFFNKLWSNIKK